MPPRRAPKLPTADRLERIAIHYLERYSASADRVRQMLERRVARAATKGAALEDPAEGRVMIEAVMEKLTRQGFLDDARFAEGRGHSLLRRGSSVRQVRMHLASRGVDGDVIDETLVKLADEAGTETRALDHAAALAYARRRRLGPFRAEEVRADYRQKDMAALGRAGFSSDLARKIIDGDEGDA